MNKNIVIPNPKKLEKIKKIMAKDGVEKLHLLADFDRTLTKLFVNKKRVPSLIAILDDKHLKPGYRQKYKELYNKYFPIETNTKISLEKKKKLMAEWWRKGFDLLIESRLKKKDLEKLIYLRKAKFREGFKEFANFLQNKNIPLIIISSSGLGGETISMFLEKEKNIYKNIHLITNNFEWDENGYALAVKKPIIHMANKDEAIIKNFPVFNLIKERKNVILLGDVIEDIGMVEGFNYNNLIKIGFLNEKVEENLENYKKHYDVVVLNDAGLECVNGLLREICRVVET